MQLTAYKFNNSTTVADPQRTHVPNFIYTRQSVAELWTVNILFFRPVFQEEGGAISQG